MEAIDKQYIVDEHNKKIAVQTMDEKQLQDTIHFEAEQYIPFDISDVNLDFQILGENETNPNQMNVFLVGWYE